MSMLLQLLLMVSLYLTDTVYAGTTPVQPKIIGGSSASTTAWPWMAGILYNKDNAIQVFCGASLIAKDWVLTAGHCVYDETPQGLAVIINRPNLLSTEGELITVEKIVVHPQFDIDSLRNDIALLKLRQSSKIPPVETLSNFSNQDEAGKISTALGWGNISTIRKIYPNKLQQVDLPIVSNEECRRRLNGIEDTMLCAGSIAGGKDTCDGDSGGPLVIFDEGSKTWRQAGLTSFGEGPCAARGLYGVYTRLELFKDFISENVCSTESKPSTPQLTLSVNGNKVTATWSKSVDATGYRLNYASYPFFTPIESIEQLQATRFSVDLPRGSAYYVAINAYNGNCSSDYSNVEHVIVQ